MLSEPFAQMHRAYVTAPLHPTIPLWSCRSGLAMTMRGAGIDGNTHVPFRIK